MIISNFVAYVKQMWKNKPDTSTPLSADRLLHIEDGIKGNSDAIEAIAAAVVSQIVNDPDKIASMAALYAVNQKIGDVANLPNSAADVVTAITQQNSKIGDVASLPNEAADVVAAIVQQNSNLNNFIVAEEISSENYSISGNSYAVVNVTIPEKDGYYTIAAIPEKAQSTGTNGVWSRCSLQSETNCECYIANRGSSDITNAKCTIRVLRIKTAFR